MAIDRSTALFFDASCLVAAAGSASGGSSFLLSLCRRDFFAGVVSDPVLMEAERNVEGKLPTAATYRYQEVLRTTPLNGVTRDWNEASGGPSSRRR
jgi:hypothetical protein